MHGYIWGMLQGGREEKGEDDLFTDEEDDIEVRQLRATGVGHPLRKRGSQPRMGTDQHLLC